MIRFEMTEENNVGEERNQQFSEDTKCETLSEAECIRIMKNTFSCNVTQLGNSYGWEVIFWNEYGLSVMAKGGTFEEAISIANFKGKDPNNWR